MWLTNVELMPAILALMGAITAVLLGRQLGETCWQCVGVWV
jgi:hypothetical protein